MKAHKNMELYNRMDIIICRSLKNYARSNPPPVGGREKLLKEASLPYKQYTSRKTNLFTILRDHLINADLENPPKGESSDCFRNQHMTLAFSFSTSWRMGI